MSKDFFMRYYVGHRGKFGHEFLEFEIKGDGKIKYANNSNYKKETLIKKEAYISQSTIDEIIRIIKESQIVEENDEVWPEGNRIGTQELEIKLGNDHISFSTCKIAKISDTDKCK
ncbi:Protein mago nashi [Intoshia linei]|uniref:Protein mago nashi n=1 Tax=Intoshia linei TaxID=1819745 RepID=A0A177BCB8_9BILA|nr:Protein mago nashi [Intoshia linei]